MDSAKISQTNNVQINNVNNKEKTTSPIKNDTKNEIKDGNKKSMNVLKWAGLIALGSVLLGGTIYAAQKGKTVKLSDVNFDKGIASLKESGEKFSGTISDTTKGGNKIKMTYKDGVLQKSVKVGENGCTKLYNYNDKGRISTLSRNGEIRNVEEKYQKGLEKLKNLKFSQDDVEKIKEEVIKDTGTILKSNGSKLDEKVKKFKAESQEETTNSSIA